jgi:DnaJ-class molecular chaperone
MTHDLPDYYAVLGVASTASPSEITHAYRRRVRSQHPDVHHDTRHNTGSERLSAVIAAYAVLRDPARRADYDQQRQSTTNTSTTPSTTPLSPPLTSPHDTRPLLGVGPVRYHGPPRRMQQ